jgi:hypothetical protein
MAVEFVELFPNAGFTRVTPTGGPGIVVPYKGSSLVLLDGGKDLKLGTKVQPMVEVKEIKDQQSHHAVVNARFPCETTDKALDLALLKTGGLRLFKITGNALVGIGAKIEAVNPRMRKVEAALKVIVLRQKLVKIAIRYVQVRNDQGELVNLSTNRVDAEKLRDEMNAIWTPQANVVFELSLTDPVTIDLLKPGQPADITEEKLKAAFVAKKDPAAALTFFMVKRAVNQDSKDLGVVNSEAGISLISDDRSSSTMAHEAGHFLGSLSESGKFSMKYGHQGTAADLLMRAGGAGSKIPYELVTNFNYGYRA